MMEEKTTSSKSKYFTNLKTRSQYIRQNPFVRRHGQKLLKIGGLGIGYGVIIEPGWIEITQHHIPVPDLHSTLEGYRICHLTDLHHNLPTPKSFHRKVIEKVRALDPDLILITGDFMSYSKRCLEICFDLYSRLQATDGILVVRGNHDHKTDLDHFENLCNRSGFEFLENRHLVLTPKRTSLSEQPNRNSPGAGLHTDLVFAGVGDLWKGEILLDQALDSAPENNPRFLLAHNPRTVEQVNSDHNIEAVFSGHTHGGQVRVFKPLMSRLSDNQVTYMEGWAETPNTRVYTSRGVGTSAFRFRWNCRPEIALHTLTCDSSSKG